MRSGGTIAISATNAVIPIIGIVFGIGIAVVAISLAHREKLKRAELRHRERMAAIERGLEIPPDPEPENDRARNSGLRSGIAGLLVGIVLYFALERVAGDDIAMFGLIPAAVGIANLVGWFVESRKKA